ncbi:MAG: hypothetical protein IAE96_11075 [Chitinophagaceae bacterium]|nr:hypothetical protein [Chitinophagaceae bacterium]
MKPVSTFLWELIHSLDPAEKTYFKRNFCSGAKDKIYLKLFTAIAAQKQYNEEALLQKLGPALNAGNMARQKNYLQQKITEALVQFDARQHPWHEIYDQIQLIRIYRQKRLYKEAFSLWKKAVANARHREAFALLNLLKTEFEKMIIFSHPEHGYEEILSVFKNNVITYQGYSELITLRDIYTESLFLRKKAHYEMDEAVRDRVRLLLDKVNQSDRFDHAQSFWFRHYYFMSKATLHYLLNQTGAALEFLQIVFQDWKTHTAFLETHGEFYIELLYMINYAGILEGAFGFVTNVFHDPLNDRITDKTHRAYFEAVKYLALNKIYNKTGRYEEVRSLVHFMKAQLGNWEIMLNDELNSTVNFSLGVGCFVLEQFSDAHYFIRKAITQFPDGNREEQVSVGQLLLLLSAWNLNQPRLYDNQYKATYNYFYKRKNKHSFETNLLQCLHRTFYITDQRKKTEIFLQTLTLLEHNQHDAVQQRAFAIFNFPGWLRSRISRVPYREYVVKKLKNDPSLTSTR